LILPESASATRPSSAPRVLPRLSSPSREPASLLIGTKLTETRAKRGRTLTPLVGVSPTRLLTLGCLALFRAFDHAFALQVRQNGLYPAGAAKEAVQGHHNPLLMNQFGRVTFRFSRRIDHQIESHHRAIDRYDPDFIAIELVLHVQALCSVGIFGVRGTIPAGRVSPKNRVPPADDLDSATNRQHDARALVRELRVFVVRRFLVVARWRRIAQLNNP
jgi:hypothetical protein